MGSLTDDKGRKEDEGPAKQVSVSSFWMGAYEVTFDEYDAFLKMSRSVRTRQPMP